MDRKLINELLGVTGQESPESQVILIQSPMTAPRWTKGTARTRSRGTTIDEEITAMPYPSRANAMIVWGAPLSNSTRGRMCATLHAASTRCASQNRRRAATGVRLPVLRLQACDSGSVDVRSIARQAIHRVERAGLEPLMVRRP